MDNRNSSMIIDGGWASGIIAILGTIGAGILTVAKALQKVNRLAERHDKLEGEFRVHEKESLNRLAILETIATNQKEQYDDIKASLLRIEAK